MQLKSLLIASAAALGLSLSGAAANAADLPSAAGYQHQGYAPEAGVTQVRYWHGGGRWGYRHGGGRWGWRRWGWGGPLAVGAVGPYWGCDPYWDTCGGWYGGPYWYGGGWRHGWYGHRGWYGRPGFYGHHGWYGHGGFGHGMMHHH